MLSVPSVGVTVVLELLLLRLSLLVFRVESGLCEELNEAGLVLGLSVQVNK